MDAGDIAKMATPGFGRGAGLFRARKALDAGCDGTIAWTGPDDQKRRSTPRWAILEGVDYPAVGRPILEPKDTTPRKAAERILADMESAFQALRKESR